MERPEICIIYLLMAQQTANLLFIYIHYNTALNQQISMSNVVLSIFIQYTYYEHTFEFRIMREERFYHNFV